MRKDYDELLIKAKDELQSTIDCIKALKKKAQNKRVTEDEKEFYELWAMWIESYKLKTGKHLVYSIETFIFNRFNAK